jgi:DNA-binding HxlR family transcriptional regulator
MSPPGHDPHDLSVPERCKLVSDVLARIGDRWAVMVVMILGAGPRRFNDLKRAIGGVSQRMLTLTLRKLERDGLVSRTVTADVPPHVEYALTPLGHSLRGPADALGAWAMQHQSEVAQKRQQFDARRS